MFLSSAPGALEQNVAHIPCLVGRKRVFLSLSRGRRHAFRQSGLLQKGGFHSRRFGRNGTGKGLGSTRIYEGRKLRRFRKPSLEKHLNYVKTALNIHTLTAWKWRP